MREKVRKVAFLTGVRTFLSQKLDLSDQLALRYVKYTSPPAGKTFSFLTQKSSFLSQKRDLSDQLALRYV